MIGVPALMAEYALGRHTRRGTVGAFAAGGFPFGRQVGWFFFCVVDRRDRLLLGGDRVGALLRAGAGGRRRSGVDDRRRRDPAAGRTDSCATSFLLQLACTAAVIARLRPRAGAKGCAPGIERASTIIMPALFLILIVLLVRALTLPGAGAGRPLVHPQVPSGPT